MNSFVEGLICCLSSSDLFDPNKKQHFNKILITGVGVIIFLPEVFGVIRVEMLWLELMSYEIFRELDRFSRTLGFTCVSL